MRRRIFTILAAFWLLVCIACCGLWIDSYMKEMWYEHAWVRQKQEEPRLFWMLITSQNGAVRFELVRQRYLVKAIAVPNASEPVRERIGAMTGSESLNQLSLAKAIAADINAIAAYRQRSKTYRPGSLTSPNSRLGFDLQMYNRNLDHVIAVQFPYWFASVSTGGLAFLCWRLRSGRLRKGLCPACGYDLCATPDKCPECGRVAATS